MTTATHPSTNAFPPLSIDAAIAQIDRVPACQRVQRAPKQGGWAATTTSPSKDATDHLATPHTIGSRTRAPTTQLEER